MRIGIGQPEFFVESYMVKSPDNLHIKMLYREGQERSEPVADGCVADGVSQNLRMGLDRLSRLNVKEFLESEV